MEGNTDMKRLDTERRAGAMNSLSGNTLPEERKMREYLTMFEDGLLVTFAQTGHRLTLG